jgi:hypothetical protein
MSLQIPARLDTKTYSWPVVFGNASKGIKTHILAVWVIF